MDEAQIVPVRYREVVGRYPRRRGPFAQNLVTLRFRQQREIRDPAPGIGDDGFKQVPEAGRHAVDRGRPEKVGAVLHRDAETIGLPRGHHGEVEESGLPFECDRVDGEPV